MKRRQTTLVCLTILGLAAVGCEKRDAGGDEAQPATAAQKPTVALPDALFLTEAPPDARTIADVKADAKAEGAVVVHGRIGGRVEPFVKGAAVFLLTDISLKSCRELHGDGCLTPWDYCCEPRDSLAANTATIQIVDADGRPLRLSLDGTHGLEPLADLTITGEISQHDEAGTLVINAQGIHVAPSAG